MGTNLITVKIEKTTYRRLQKYLDGIEHYNVSGGTSSLIDYAIEHDALGRKAARKEARKAERAERKAAEAASAPPQEEQERVWRTGEEWTSSEDYKAVSNAVRAEWAKADMEGRERINREWLAVREDEQAATDYLHTLQKAG